MKYYIFSGKGEWKGEKCVITAHDNTYTMLWRDKETRENRAYPLGITAKVFNDWCSYPHKVTTDKVKAEQFIFLDEL